MKFNFKKIAAIGASVLMTGMTMGVAAAASFPAPFVQDGVANSPAIVYGAGALLSDYTAAESIQTYLGSQLNAVGSTVNGISIETGSQKLYLGDYMNDTKVTLTKDNLPDVLADGTVAGATKDYDYNLKIGVPNTVIKYGKPTSDFDKPVLYADFSSGEYYTLKIVFPSAVNLTELTNENIKLFGEDYSFAGSESSLTNESIVLYKKSTPIKIKDGESKTVEGHDISVICEDSKTATITVDGVSKSEKEGWAGKINSVDIYLKNVIAPNVVTEGTRQVELYLNADKLKIDDEADITLGSNELSGTSATFTGSNGKTSEIDIIVTPSGFDDSVEYIEEGKSFTDPVFSGLKFGLNGANPAIDADSRGKISLKASGEKKVSLEFTNKNDNKYSLDVLRPSDVLLNDSWAENATNGEYNATELGVGEDHKLIVDPSSNISKNDYFITTTGEYSQIWKVKSITLGTSPKVSFKDQGTGITSSIDVSLNGETVGSTGSLSLADGSTVTVNLTNASATASERSITISSLQDFLYTKDGAKIYLGTANAPSNSSSVITIQEETDYNDGDFRSNKDGHPLLGGNITMRFVYKADRSGKDMYLQSIKEPSNGIEVGDYDKYYLTDYGTSIKQTGDTDKTVDILYSKEAMSLDFSVGGSSEGSSGDIGSIIYKDTETERASYADKNVIVVGGSCINKAAARLLNVPEGTCGAEWTAKTGVGAGDFLVRGYVAPEGVTTQTAILVAGYEAADTLQAAQYLTSSSTNDFDSSTVNHKNSDVEQA